MADEEDHWRVDTSNDQKLQFLIDYDKIESADDCIGGRGMGREPTGDERLSVGREF